MRSVKSFLRKMPFHNALRRAYRRFRNVPRHSLQDFKTEKGLQLLRLGTEYGGWTFLNGDDLYGCTIVSAGLGEDASFDVEFATKYRARVIIVDPTPRAVQHFRSIVGNVGKPRDVDYVESGCQPIGAYDLSEIKPDQLVLVDKALWNRATVLRFFEPPNREHVSHSIVNYQHGYRDDTSFIEVGTITADDLLARFDLNIKEVAILKLDIEGAEIEVLHDCLNKGIVPKQILVEFDELNCPSEIGFRRVTDMHACLLKNGYRLVHTDGQADFLYIKN